MKNKKLHLNCWNNLGWYYDNLKANISWASISHIILETSWPFLLLLFGFLSVQLCAPWFACAGLENSWIEVYAEIDNGSRMELFINSNWNSPWRQEIVGKVLYKYKFRKPPEDINSLRLDITDASEGHVYIKKVVIFAPNQKEYSLSFDPSSIKLNNLSISNNSKEGIHLAVTGPDPWILFHTDILLNSSLSARVKNLMLDFPMIFYFAILWGILNCLPTYGKTLANLKIFISGFFLFMIVDLTLPFVIASTRTLPSTTNAVGGAVFSGYSFAGQQRGFFWLVILTLLSGVLLFLIGRSRDKL
jgi:hypothetical protein